MPTGCAFSNQVGKLRVPGLDLIKPSHQTVIAFLVLGLIERNVGVFLDALLYESSSDIYLRFKFGKFTLKAVVSRLLERTSARIWL